MVRVRYCGHKNIGRMYNCGDFQLTIGEISPPIPDERAERMLQDFGAAFELVPQNEFEKMAQEKRGTVTEQVKNEQMSAVTKYPIPDGVRVEVIRRRFTETIR